VVGHVGRIDVDVFASRERMGERRKVFEDAR
jgi:hypothetical protein